MKIVSSFSDRLKQILSIRDIKPSDFALMVDINKSTISQYINGIYEPKRERISKFAKVLNVSEAWLVGYDVPMTNLKTNDNDEIDISHLTEEEKTELNTIINSNFIMYFNGKKDNTEEAKESLRRALIEAYLEVVEISKKKKGE